MGWGPHAMCGAGGVRVDLSGAPSCLMTTTLCPLTSAPVTGGCLRSLPVPVCFPFEGHLGPRGSVTLNICWALGYYRNGAGFGGRQTQGSPLVSLGLESLIRATQATPFLRTGWPCKDSTVTARGFGVHSLSTPLGELLPSFLPTSSKDHFFQEAPLTFTWPII